MHFTLEQIEAGDGLLTPGERTLIYRLPNGCYITCSKSEKPQSPDAELVAGGTMFRTPDAGKAGRRFRIDWM